MSERYKIIGGPIDGYYVLDTQWNRRFGKVKTGNQPYRTYRGAYKRLMTLRSFREHEESAPVINDTQTNKGMLPDSLFKDIE